MTAHNTLIVMPHNDTQRLLRALEGLKAQEGFEALKRSHDTQATMLASNAVQIAQLEAKLVQKSGDNSLVTQDTALLDALDALAAEELNRNFGCGFALTFLHHPGCSFRQTLQGALNQLQEEKKHA